MTFREIEGRESEKEYTYVYYLIYIYICRRIYVCNARAPRDAGVLLISFIHIRASYVSLVLPKLSPSLSCSQAPRLSVSSTLHSLWSAFALLGALVFTRLPVSVCVFATVRVRVRVCIGVKKNLYIDTSHAEWHGSNYCFAPTLIRRDKIDDNSGEFSKKHVQVLEKTSFLRIGEIVSSESQFGRRELARSKPKIRTCSIFIPKTFLYTELASYHFFQM